MRHPPVVGWCAAKTMGSDDLDLLVSGHPEDVGRFHDRHVDALNEWFAQRAHDPDDVADLTAETLATALMEHRRATRPADEWLLGLAERQLSAYRRRGDAERRMRRRLGMKDGHLRRELVAASERGVPSYVLPSARTVLVTVAAVALAAILIVAFTGGRRDEPAPRPTAAPAGDRGLFGGALEPGVRYRPPSFIPSVSFEVADREWYLADGGATTSLLLQRRSDARAAQRAAELLILARMTEVYDPEQRGLTASLIPAPADLKAWLSAHPDLRVGGSEPVTVAGVPGEAFPAAVRFRRPAHTVSFCRRAARPACTAIAPGVLLLDGMRLRMIYLRAEPDPLLITLTAGPGGDLAALEAAAAPLLESLRIGAE
jgi:DNA-directed RNA polymerase specialized sigma24 family protein